MRRPVEGFRFLYIDILVKTIHDQFFEEIDFHENYTDFVSGAVSMDIDVVSIEMYFKGKIGHGTFLSGFKTRK